MKIKIGFRTTTPPTCLTIVEWAKILERIWWFCIFGTIGSWNLGFLSILVKTQESPSGILRSGFYGTIWAIAVKDRLRRMNGNGFTCQEVVYFCNFWCCIFDVYSNWILKRCSRIYSSFSSSAWTERCRSSETRYTQTEETGLSYLHRSCGKHYNLK